MPYKIQLKYVASEFLNPDYIKDSNIEEIKSAMKNRFIDQDWKKIFNRRNENYLPELLFYSDKEIEDGYYSFRIENFVFNDCHVKKGSIVDGRTLYFGNNYYVVMDV